MNLVKLLFFVVSLSLITGLPQSKQFYTGPTKCLSFICRVIFGDFYSRHKYNWNMSYLTFLFQTKMCVPIVIGLDRFQCNVSIDQFHVAAAIMVQWSIGVRKRKQDVICICKHGDAIYLSWQLCTYRHIRKIS